MKNPEMSERMKARMLDAKQQEQQEEYAGDNDLPLGENNEKRKAYPALLRGDYEFPIDVNSLQPDDIIQQSGCNSLGSDI